MTGPADTPPLYGAPRDGIACPACGYTPAVGMQWTCGPDGCGGHFDTFETRAACPHCHAQFIWTQCPACQRMSPHKAWYRTAAQ